MTFMGRNGTQYVVIAAGGPGDTDRGGCGDAIRRSSSRSRSADRVTTDDAAVSPGLAPRAAARQLRHRRRRGPPCRAERLEQGRQLTEQILHDVPRAAGGNGRREDA